MKTFNLADFVLESNEIESIKSIWQDEIEAHEAFLMQPYTLDTLKHFVMRVAFASLRQYKGMDVEIRGFIPEAGGAMVMFELERILIAARTADKPHLAAYEIHQRYEHLHPFMDGNGRSGRALWLHMMGGIDKVPLGFLHTYYYQSLRHSEES